MRIAVTGLIEQYESESFFEAQLIQVDIAVGSSSLGGLLSELEHALEVSYETAMSLNLTPFEKFYKHNISPMDRIFAIPLDVPDDVARALQIQRKALVFNND